MIVGAICPSANEAYGLPSDGHGLSHGLKNMPPACFLPLLRKGRPFKSHHRPKYKKKGYLLVSFLFMGWVMGLEPTTPGTTIQCSAN